MGAARIIKGAVRLFPGLGLLGVVACGGPSGHGTMGPPPPPPVPRIVFDMATPGAGGHRDLYGVALDGTGLTRLTADTTDHHWPAAQGHIVYFASTRVSASVVARVSVSGGSQSSATDIVDGADEPTVSSNGRLLAYVSTAGGLPRVWIALADGSLAHRWTPADAGWDGAVERHPVWSPTDDRLAYVSTRSNNASVYVGALNGATGSTTLLTGSATGASVEPSWSPDGGRIVFASNRDGPSDLYVVAVNTGVVSRLTHVAMAGQPVWLATGQIVFTQWTGGIAGLRWLDPQDPAVLHTIPTVADAQHAAALP